MEKETKRKTPYKSDIDKQIVRLEFRLTPKQAEELKNKVEDSNLTTSEFIRKKLKL